MSSWEDLDWCHGGFVAAYTVVSMHYWLDRVIVEAQETVPKWGAGGGGRRMNSSSGSALAAARFSSWKHNLSWYEGVIAIAVDGACMMPRKFNLPLLVLTCMPERFDKGSEGFSMCEL